MTHLRFGKFLASLICAFSLFVGFTSQASASLTPLNDDTEFVKQVYSDFLHRTPSSEDLSYQVNQLAAGTYGRGEFVEKILLSTEFQDNIAPVLRLYFTYFLRIPDYGGLMFWIDSYMQGMTLDAISNEFVKSPEFIATYGQLSNQDYVNQMYLNIYDRQPDSGGLDFWTGHIEAGRLTRGQVMVEFSAASEYLAKSADQVYVTMNFMGLLRRAPEQSEFDTWVGLMEGGASGLGLVDSVLLSNDYTDRFSAGSIDFDDDGDGYTDSQGDCNDANNSINPIATETCGDGIDQNCSGSDAICSAPEAFTMELLGGRTFYQVWFGSGEDALGNEIDDVPVVAKIEFGSNGIVTMTGLLNHLNYGGPYGITSAGALYFENDITGQNVIICSTADYIATDYEISGEFDNVDLFFFSESAAMAYAVNLNRMISPACNNYLTSLLSGRTLYTTVSGQYGTLESWVFNADATSFTYYELVDNDGEYSSNTIGVTVNDMALILEDPEDGNIEINISEVTSDYIEIGGVPVLQERLYFDRTKAEENFGL